MTEIAGIGEAPTLPSYVNDMDRQVTVHIIDNGIVVCFPSMIPGAPRERRAYASDYEAANAIAAFAPVVRRAVDAARARSAKEAGQRPESIQDLAQQAVSLMAGVVGVEPAEIVKHIRDAVLGGSGDSSNPFDLPDWMRGDDGPSESAG